ncbi:putative membrane protein [Yersinia ruckeri ATCC 29473]|uniref:Uncharacterized protein n=1 Tax=Yersinia ruckeri TaxID=29486 RepID=A0A380QMF9_YERRU|nr:hypothetical protein QMA0440_01944 [Yersinia ruckeri]KGA49984.1 putative membrane protein [Yersinia ruckeri ATCC 29473]KFE39388.1 hypothetical protein nADLYRO1b_1103 [Yersinia ruckeri]QTD76378.1 Uncharacterized protein YR821_1451 [Yersinia ruckeri]CNB54265.1 Uncharacterised protein [Yersinia ruckeri]
MHSAADYITLGLIALIFGACMYGLFVTPKQK